MPAVGFTLFSRSATYTPRSTATHAMTSPARSCATENWVGINKKDFYSLIDRIYSAEEERMSQTENQSTSSDVKHTADDARNDVTSSHRPRSADGNSSDGNEDTREDDCRRTRSPDVEQSFRDMPALHETYIRKDHIDDTPLDLTRHGRGDRMTSSPIRSSSQTTPFSLLAGMGGLNHLLAPARRFASRKSPNRRRTTSGWEIASARRCARPRTDPTRSRCEIQVGPHLECQSRTLPLLGGQIPD